MNGGSLAPLIDTRAGRRINVGSKPPKQVKFATARLELTRLKKPKKKKKKRRKRRKRLEGGIKSPDFEMGPDHRRTENINACSFFLLIVFFCFAFFSPLLKIRRGKSGEILNGCKASSGHDF
jgi:hypothetical protein